MERMNSIIKVKKYEHLSIGERMKIEGLLEAKKKAGEISRILRRHKSTICREINRGSVHRLQYDLSEKEIYRANVGQADYVKRGKNKERGLKIGKDRRLEEHIRKKLLGGRFSPDAIIGEIKVLELKFERMITAKTLYNYIDQGIFSGISNKDLWEKRKRKRRGYQPVARISYRNRNSRSIEDRPQAINNRLEYGHWEGDCVKGPLRAKTSLLTLTERKSREQIIIKIEQATQEAVKKAVDGLEIKYGTAFNLKFKSVTFDNGNEFLGWRSLEVSIQGSDKKRITVYFAHSYSAWERGTNENQNRMIRRFIPKGTDIADVSTQQIKSIENWMNNYPRKILGYKTAKQMAQEYLQSSIDLKACKCRT